MNPNCKFKNNKVDNSMFTTILCSTIVIVLAVAYALLLDDVHKKNVQKLSQPPVIVCSKCKGTGEYPTDVNKLMMEASLALFINHHLMVDRCEKCVKLKSGDGYAYCDVVNDRYTILMQEYGAAGRKIEMAACDKCMGMGTFTCKKADGTYKTQKEYDEENEKN